jgi:integrase
MRSTKPHVKRWKWAKTPDSEWVVQGLRNQTGGRVRRFFKSRDDANEWLRNRRPEIKSQGGAAMDLSDSQRVDAVRALAILAPYGSNLTAAAQMYHERAKLLSRTVLFSALRDEMVQRKKKDGKSARHVGDLRTRLAAFGQAFDGRPVAGIETREIDDWVSGLNLSLTSRFNFRKVLRNAFQFAISRGYASENPVIKTGRVKADELAPGTLTPAEVEALLNAADPRIVSSIALSAFAGLRDAEVGRITWDRIDFDGGFVKIDASVAKTSSRRLIPLLPNLREWLAPHAKKTGLVRPSQRTSYLLYSLAKKKAVEALTAVGQPCANLEVWPHNALRHSFVSYRLAVVANAAQVAEECGHSVAIMKKNYRELVTPREAEAWFSVLPANAAANVVPFKREVQLSG